LDKGQIFTLDMVIASIIFASVLSSSMMLWQFQRDKAHSEEQRIDMETMSGRTMSLLMETKGLPENWTQYPTDDIYSFGLVDEYLVVNRTKLNDLSALDYNSVKEILGILGPDYEFGFEVSVMGDEGYIIDASFGLVPDSNSSEVIVVSRECILDGDLARAVLEVWKR